MTQRSYTAAEYRKAGVNAGPYALEANPDQNYRTSRRKPIRGIVMHITAGMTDYVAADTSADATTRYGATTTADASWHTTIDSDGIIPCIRDTYVAWHAGVGPDYWSHPARPYVNDATLGIEQGTGQVDWRKAPAWWVERTLRNVAVWCASRVKEYGIPLVVVRNRDTVGDAIMAGRAFGFVAHATMAPHNRRDPGMVGNPPAWVDTYPWAQLFGYIREEMALLTGTATSPEEDDMFEPTDRDLLKYVSLQVKNTAQLVVNKAAEDAGRDAALASAVAQIDASGSVDLAAVQAAAKAGSQEALTGPLTDAITAAVTAAVAANPQGLSRDEFESVVRGVFADAGTSGS